MSTALALVPSASTVAQRVRQLQVEARGLAKEHIRALATAIDEAGALATEIAAGGDAYPPGVRDIARRFADEAAARSQTLEAIVGRT